MASAWTADAAVRRWLKSILWDSSLMWPGWRPEECAASALRAGAGPTPPVWVASCCDTFFASVPFYALIVQRLTSNCSIEETPRENHSLLSLICLLTKMATRNFLTPQRKFVAKKWGYRWELAVVFGSNIPLALLIDPWKFHVDVLKGKKVCSEKPTHIWAKIGQNPLYT